MLYLSFILLFCWDFFFFFCLGGEYRSRFMAYNEVQWTWAERISTETQLETTTVSLFSSKRKSGPKLSTSWFCVDWLVSNHIEHIHAYTYNVCLWVCVCVGMCYIYHRHEYMLLLFRAVRADRSTAIETGWRVKSQSLLWRTCSVLFKSSTR